MNGKYNQPTAHMLQPVKGWDSMAHLDFVAPIAPFVKDALPGTVMHLNSNGQLQPGLTAQGMGMYLFYKMWDEDVQPYPLTADGSQMTAVGMQSFGGYNSEMYLRKWDSTDPYNTNGQASNVGAYDFSDAANLKAKVKASASAHTTYPAICGMELSSTEFAATTGAGSTIVYNVNDTLTSPEPAATLASNPGTYEQQAAGGFLKKGVCYKDPICGIVSKKPVINEHGYKQICFWSCWLPALSADFVEDGAVLTASSTGLFWDAPGSSSSADTALSVFNGSTVSVAYDNVREVVGAKKTATVAANSAFKFDITVAENSTGLPISDVTFVVKNAGTPVTSATTGFEVTTVAGDPNTLSVAIDKDTVASGKVSAEVTCKIGGTQFTGEVLAEFTFA